MLIYSEQTNRVLAKIPEGQPYDNLYEDPLNHLVIDDYPIDFYNYKVVDGELIKMSELELEEIGSYNRVLTEDERFEKEMLNRLMPNGEEIRKAEQTIEILSLLQEVI